LESFGIDLESFSQFLCSRIVEEGNVLVEIRHNQFVAEFLITRHAAQSPADNRFVVAQRGACLQVEQLDAAGLQQRREIARAVVGRKNKRTERRHLTGVEGALKLGGFSFLFRAINFSAFDSFAQCFLDRRQDSVAAFCILLVLLIIIEPKRSVNANEHENQLRNPAAEAQETRAFSSCLIHG